MEPEHLHDVEPAASGRVERLRLFLSEVSNELKRATWPSRREVYATSVVVIVMSFVFGVYLTGLDLLLDRFVFLIFRRFGAG